MSTPAGGRGASEITLAAANMRISHDKERNLARMLEISDEAAALSVDILVFPEMALQGYMDYGFQPGDEGYAAQQRYFAAEAEPTPGPATTAIAEKARAHHMTIQFGLAERTPREDVILNSTALVSPEGLVGVYRKVHNQAEFPMFHAGDDLPVFDLGSTRVGSLICYDLAFPEVMRSFAVKGAEIALLSNGWAMTGHDAANDRSGESMNLAARANAFFNQMWLVVSNHCEDGDTDRDWIVDPNTGVRSGALDYWGHSQIVDPNGIVVASLEREEGLVVHTVDLKHRLPGAKEREGSPDSDGVFGSRFLDDRLPQHYVR